MKKLGLIVNPIAGMGGSVGLKGTDGVLSEALSRGAVPKAPGRCLNALKELLPCGEDIVIVTCGNDMGENEALSLTFNTKVVYRKSGGATDREDTIKGAEAIIEEGVDILVFAGGDGTVRDICSVVGEDVLSLGIPAGVKIHSPVYAQSPEKAGQLLRLFVEGKASASREAEVLDIDEEEYRQGRVSTRLYGYMRVPLERRFMQSRKAPSPESERAQQDSIASEIVKGMAADTMYIIGPGSTTRALMELLGLPYSLIGVDIICNGALIKKDVSEQDILTITKGWPTKLILTPTGGQGYLLGRGNQQLSPSVINNIGRQNIIVVATKEKLAGLMGEPLHVDTGDKATDILLEGYAKVVTGLMEAEMYKVRR